MGIFIFIILYPTVAHHFASLTSKDAAYEHGKKCEIVKDCFFFFMGCEQCCEKLFLFMEMDLIYYSSKVSLHVGCGLSFIFSDLFAITNEAYSGNALIPRLDHKFYKTRDIRFLMDRIFERVLLDIRFESLGLKI